MDKGLNSEYKFLNRNIRDITAFYGVFLIFWGLIVSVISDSQSITSWIPALLGLPIMLMAIFSTRYPNRQKLLMHFAVIFGLIVFLGGLDFLRSVISGSNPFENIYVGSSKLMMLLTGAFFCTLCIQSFRYIRKEK